MTLSLQPQNTDPYLETIAKQLVDDVLFEWARLQQSIQEPSTHPDTLAYFQQQLNYLLDATQEGGGFLHDRLATTQTPYINGLTMVNTWLALCVGDVDMIDSIADDLSDQHDAYACAYAHAMHERDLDYLSDHTNLWARLAVMLFRNWQQPQAAFIQKALTDDSVLQTHAMLAIAYHRLESFYPDLINASGNSDSAIAFAARRALSLLHQEDRGIGEFCNDESFSFQAIACLAPILPAESIFDWINRDLNSARLQVFALGQCANIQAIPTLIETLKHPALVRLSSEAIIAITGLDPDEGDLLDLEPPGIDEQYYPKAHFAADEQLPTLDSDAVNTWWQSKQTSYQGQSGWFFGNQLAHAEYPMILAKAPQRIRHQAAIRQWLTGGNWFDVSMPWSWQAQYLPQVSG